MVVDLRLAGHDVVSITEQMPGADDETVIDFEKVIRDPNAPTRLLPAYDSGDHAHPNDVGYRAMADAVDLSLFRDDDDD